MTLISKVNKLVSLNGKLLLNKLNSNYDRKYYTYIYENPLTRLKG